METEKEATNAPQVHYPIFPKDDAKLLLFYDIDKKQKLAIKGFP
jgi:hypothetical protein